MWPLNFKHFHWWKRWSWSKFASHYARGTNKVCECKMDAKSTWILTWHPMDHVSWSLRLFSQNHFLEVGLTLNRETTALQTLTTINSFCIIMVENPHEQFFFEIALGRGPRHIWLHTTLEGPWLHYMILEMCWHGLCILSFGLSQFHGHASRLVCEVTLIHSPHLLKQATSERFVLAWATFTAILASESHWLQPAMVLFVHWWPTPISVGGLLVLVRSPCEKMFVKLGVGHVAWHSHVKWPPKPVIKWGGGKAREQNIAFWKERRGGGALLGQCESAWASIPLNLDKTINYLIIMVTHPLTPPLI